jgi:hypothetical protein
MLPNWGEFFSHHNKSALATFFFFLQPWNNVDQLLVS